MDLEVLEKDKEKLTVLVKGETHTLSNLLRSAAWETGARQASYILEHPYLKEPKIIIRGENPQKILTDAARLIASESEEFGKEFKRALKK